MNIQPRPLHIRHRAEMPNRPRRMTASVPSSWSAVALAALLTCTWATPGWAHQVKPSGWNSEHLDCGGHLEEPCTIATDFWWISGSGGCDRGLRESNKRCVNGTGVRARFNETIKGDLAHYRKDPGGTCQKSTPNNLLAVDSCPDLNAGLTRYWIAWALKNQRAQIAVDEPINWVMHAYSHNAMSNLADGYIWPLIRDQTYSITDQLRQGARILEIDTGVMGAQNWLRVGHGEIGPTDRLWFSTIKEIGAWLKANPDEFIGIGGDWGNVEEVSKYIEPIKTYLGSKVMSKTEWPTVLTLCQTHPDRCKLQPGDENFAPLPPRMPTRREMLAVEKNVIFSGSVANVRIWPKHLFTSSVGAAGDNIPASRHVVFSTSSPVDAADCVGCEGDLTPECSTLEYLTATSGDVGYVPGNLARLPDGATFSAQRLHWKRIREARASANLGLWVGLLNESRYAELARCNVTAPAMDMIGRSVSGATANRMCDVALVPHASCDEGQYDEHLGAKSGIDKCDESVSTPCPSTDYRLRGLVWSWKPGDFGKHGYALLDDADGRWTSADRLEQHRFACAKPRTGDPLDWPDQQGEMWRVTTAADAWDMGDIICETEFANDGLVFAVPRNGWQNERLKEQVPAGEDVWLNYRAADDASGWHVEGRSIAELGVATRCPSVDHALPNGVVYDEGAAVELVATKLNPSCGQLSYHWNFGDTSSADAVSNDSDPITLTKTKVYADNLPLADAASCENCGAIDTAAQQQCVNLELITNGLFWTACVDNEVGVGSSPDEALAACLQELRASRCPDANFTVTSGDTVVPTPYILGFTATDPNGATDSQDHQISVLNVAPLLGNLSATAVDENGTVTLTGTITDPGVLDTFVVSVNWGDPLDPQTTHAIHRNAGATDFSMTYQYLDDDPSGTAMDTYTIAVTLRDKDGGEDSDNTQAVVSNVAPNLSNLTITPINENGTVTLTGTITDPGTLDTFTLDIDWGDPLSPSNAQQTTYGASASPISFSLTHQYLDDNPTGTPSDNYSVSLTLKDDDGGQDTAVVAAQVANVSPQLVSLSATPIDENGTTTLTGTISDPGTLDTFTVDVDWGDPLSPGNTTQHPYGAGASTFTLTHQYLDDNPTATPQDSYAISLTVTDDDTGSSGSNTSVQVANLVPHGVTIQSLSDETGAVIGQDVPVALLGLVIDLAGHFSDTGTLDTHAAATDWGDGTTTASALTQGSGSGSVADSHAYLQPGTHGLTLMVTDDDGGASQAQSTLRVVDAIGAAEETILLLEELTSSDPVAAAALASALDKIRGDNGGADSNGALDRLQQGTLVAALEKFTQALGLIADASAADPTLDTQFIRGILALTGKSVAVQAIARAESRASNPSDDDKIASARASVAAGDDDLAAGDHVGAVSHYKVSVQTLADLGQV